MTYYALYNKKLDTYLTHPKIGVWSTNDITEAESMLSVCQEYVRSLNIPDYEHQFSIVDLEAQQE